MASDPIGVLVVPGDLGGQSREDVRRCVEAFLGQPDRVVVASRAGSRGHPILVPSNLFDAILGPVCDAGLRALPRSCPERVFEVECKGIGVVHDVDTPEDYQSLLGELGQGAGDQR